MYIVLAFYGHLAASYSRDRCYDFLIFSPKIGGKIGVFDSKLNYEKKLEHNIVFEKNAIFSPNIGENSRKLWS
jgi:hypothetical protein